MKRSNMIVRDLLGYVRKSRRLIMIADKNMQLMGLIICLATVPFVCPLSAIGSRRRNRVKPKFSVLTVKKKKCAEYMPTFHRQPSPMFVLYKDMEIIFITREKNERSTA